MANRQKKSSARVRVLLFAGLLGLSCGVEGLYLPGVIDGSEAADRVADAVYGGIVLCMTRQGTASTDVNAVSTTVLQRELNELEIVQYYGIDSARGYRNSDVSNCTEYIRNGIALSSDCDYKAFQCYLEPVDRFTGSR
ncbi:MAG: TIGR04452 family lipoprotein [Spirochaetales bacterium]|nr:TIGR04452 family lipoprotein [Leptospiraceae bacterium]MCP5482051.1 TIGR04452 family lipoprotein [Spirochaetales bacterium]MCP5484993.1 TIGR04452 family lipoprotein [Spirochaetales bacterium]